jgi:hypothetical protein
MNAVERLEGALFTGPKPEEILKKSADQAEHLKEELRIGSMTKADPVTAHIEEIRRITNNYDEEDARTALDVLVIKHPFIVMDTLKGYFQSMDEDLKELRKVFTQRESYESEICGGDRI